MRIRRLAAASALALALAACSGSPEPTTSPEGTPVPPGPVEDGTPLGAGDAAPSPSDDTRNGDATSPGGASGNAEVLAFTAPTLDGGRIEGAELAGGDVVLWMWAPW